jgi:hypothetical protein
MQPADPLTESMEYVMRSLPCWFVLTALTLASRSSIAHQGGDGPPGTEGQGASKQAAQPSLKEGKKANEAHEARVVVAKSATLHDLMEALRSWSRKQEAQAVCFIALGARVPETTALVFGAGKHTHFGSFTCDESALLPLLEGRAIANESWFIDLHDGTVTTEAHWREYGPRGKAFIGRLKAAIWSRGPATEDIKNWRELAAQDVRSVLVFSPLNQSLAPAAKPASAAPDAPPAPSPPAAAKPSASVSSGKDLLALLQPLKWDDIRPVVRKKWDEFRACAVPETGGGASQGPAKARGSIVLDVTVAPDGTVSDVVDYSSTLPSRASDLCVIAAARTMVFPEPQGGHSALISFPLLFEEAEPASPEQ